MAQRLTYQKPHKLSLLHDELIAAGISPLLVEGDTATIWVTVGDTVPAAQVAAVVDAHDPAVLSLGEKAAEEADAARSELRSQYQAATQRLDAIIQEGGTYTAGQVRDAVVDLARIQRRMLRLMRAAA